MHGHVSRILKNKCAAPMTVLKRPYDKGPGKPVGSYATHPIEKDDILHFVWDPITHGNAQSLKRDVYHFQNSYQHFIYKAPEWQLQDLTVEDFQEVCNANKKSAPGLDGWASCDLALVSPLAISLLVQFLNSIENGAPWPKQMLETRAVFLCKNPSDTANPLNYRILKITSGLYRKWASVRLRNLAGWVDTWDHPAFNAGVPKKGAQDAWLRTALKLELNNLSGEHTAGGSIDIYKCFDQINRSLLYHLAKEAGMPLRVLNC